MEEDIQGEVCVIVVVMEVPFKIGARDWVCVVGILLWQKAVEAGGIGSALLVDDGVYDIVLLVTSYQMKLEFCGHVQFIVLSGLWPGRPLDMDVSMSGMWKA